MSLIVLGIELTENDIIKKLGLYTDGSLKAFSFCPPKLVNLINRQHGIQIIYIELIGEVEGWIMISSLLSFRT